MGHRGGRQAFMNWSWILDIRIPDHLEHSGVGVTGYAQYYRPGSARSVISSFRLVTI